MLFDMEPDEKDELEMDYLRLDAKLEAFFPGGEEARLSEQELHDLTPILNSIKDFEERYEYLEELATGTEKRIVLVYDRRLGRRVAMAFGRKSRTSLEQEDFLREARLLAQLVHPYIPPVYNIGIHPDGEPFFTMELLPGDDLHQVIKRLKQGDEQTRAAFPLKERLNLFLKICDAMEYAHSHHVIHRDLKPGNLKYGSYGEIFVCDWGMAHVLDPDEELGRQQETHETVIDGYVVNEFSSSDMIKGTPGYMAPEQTYDCNAADRQSDIYSLGVILYSLLTYELPVGGESAHEMIQHTRDGRLIPVQARKHGISIPRVLSAVAFKAMSINPQERYASARELGEDVGRYLGGFAPQAGNAGVLFRMSLFLQRHSRTAIMVLAALGLLAGLATASALVINRQKNTAESLREAAENNLTLYMREQQASRQFGFITDLALNVAYGSPKVETLHSIVNVLETELRSSGITEGHRDNFLLLKGSVHFYLQEFNAALGALNQIRTSTYDSEALLAASQLGLSLKSDDEARMSSADLAHVFGMHDKIALPRRVVLMTYLYHVMRNSHHQDTGDYFPLLSVVLKTMNGFPWNSAEQPAFSVQEDGKVMLDFSGMNISILRLPQMGHQLANVAGPVGRIEYLDISHTKIVDITELGGLEACTVRMVGLSLSAPWHMITILRNMKVEKVIIDTENYPPGLVAELEQRFEVVKESAAPAALFFQPSLVADAFADQLLAKPEAGTFQTMKKVFQAELDADRLSVSKRDQLLGLKGMVHFYLQEFNEAVQCLSLIQSPGLNDQNLLRASRDGAALKPDDRRMLTEKNLAALLSGNPDYYIPRSAVLSCFLNHIQRSPHQPDSEEYLQLANVVLRVMNGFRPDAEVGAAVSERGGGAALDLSGLDIYQLRLPEMGHQLSNVFGPLMDIEHLDISYTQLSDITELGGITAQSIRMVGLDVKVPGYLPTILKNMKVERVVLDVANYPPDVIRRLEKFCEVVDEPLVP